MATNLQRRPNRTATLDADWRPDMDDELPDDRVGGSEPDTSEPAEGSDLDDEEIPCTDDDDSRWEAFIPDDDERDPEPEQGDFWTESRESRVECREPEIECLL